MSIAEYLGLATMDAERHDSGQGRVYERTLIVGETVLAIENIGTMRIIDGKKNHGLTVVGTIIAFFGLMTLMSNFMIGLLLLLAGAAVAVWNYMRKVDMYLSLGTSDGRSTVIISKNRDFLHAVREFLRQKIDTRNIDGATINISNSTLEGNFALGAGASARQSLGGEAA